MIDASAAADFLADADHPMGYGNDPLLFVALSEEGYQLMIVRSFSQSFSKQRWSYAATRPLCLFQRTASERRKAELPEI